MHWFLILPAVLSALCLPTYSEGSPSNDESSDILRPVLPAVTLLVDRVGSGYDLFEYVKPVRDADFKIITPSQSFQIFVGQYRPVKISKILFMQKSRTSAQASALATSVSLPIDIQLKLTCGAEYFTKWRFNSDQRVANPEEVSDVEYSLEFKDRGEENIASTGTIGPEPVTEYTESPKLTIRLFQLQFKSLTIDCVNYHNESMRSRVHIFQRLDSSEETFRDARGEYLNLTQGAVVPCKVHDPDVRVSLIRYDKKDQLFRNITHRFRYDWTQGFKPSDGSLQYNDGDEYRCELSNGKSVTHGYDTNAKFPDLQTTRVIIRIAKTSVPSSIWTFACSLSDYQKESDHTILLHSIQVEACESPDYCYLNRGQDAEVRTKRCTHEENEDCNFPKLTYEQGRISKLHAHGKVTCFVEIDQKFYASHDYYFRGTSRDFYLLSGSFKQKEMVEINMWRSMYRPYKTYFTCTALKFLTYNFPSMTLSYTSDTSTQELKPLGRNTFFNDANEYGFRNVEIQVTRDALAVNCHVPIYNSTQWMTAKHIFTKEDGGRETIPRTVLPTTTRITTTTTTTPTTTTTTTRTTTTTATPPPTTATLLPEMEEISTCKTTKRPEDDLTANDSKAETRPTQSTSTSTTASTPESGTHTDKSTVEPSIHGDTRIIIVTVVFAAIMITFLIIGITVHRKKVRNLQEKLRELTDDEIQTFFDGSPGEGDQAPAGYGFIESQPFNKDYEIPTDQLKIQHDKKLGSGAFGLVFKGTLKGSNESGSRTAVDMPVAVKTVKPNVEVSIFVALLTEMKVMCFVGDHPHIVALHGAQTTKIRTREVYIALEFCANGDLLNFIKKNRTDFDDLISKTKKTVHTQVPCEPVATALYANQMTTITISQPPTDYLNVPASQLAVMSTFDLLKWAQEISSGMEFLGSKNVIHGDLAARNVLLTADKTAKVSDFGLSRQLHNYSTYKKKTKTPLPWKWMAIESLSDMEFSVQSDVWSFGVTLFEIFSLGTIPYPGRTWTNEFVDELVAGLRLNTPKFGNDEIRILMMDCMKLEPLERIKFQEMGHRFTDIRRKLESQLNLDSLSNYIVV